MKRWISLILMLSCILSLLPATVWAQPEPEVKTPGTKLVALTFDDGPASYTKALLDGLAKRGARVTFFMTGASAQNNGNLVRRAFSEGHQIAQHTYSHPTLSSLSASQIAYELQRTDDILNGHLGESFKYILRPPYGDNNDYVMRNIGRPAIMWTVDTRDWENRNSSAVCNNIVNWTDDGEIVLCHDIHSTTIPGALAAIDIMQAQGYEFVTINELFRRRGVPLEEGKKYYRCENTGVDYGRAGAPEVSTIPHYGSVDMVLTGDPGTEIYYTLDGSSPLTNGQLYTGPVSLPRDGANLRAIAAYDRNGDCSAETAQHVGPAQGLPLGLLIEDGKVVFDNPNADTEILYSTDGTFDPDTALTYAEPVPCYDGNLIFSVVGQGIRSWPKKIYVTEEGNLFWDVATDAWYAGEINEAVLSGIFKGTGEYVFDPELGTTRAMFVTALCRMLEDQTFDEEAEEVAFPDVAEDMWYTEAVAWASGYGLVNGYEDGFFLPDRPITREELCVILDRMLVLMGVKVEGDLPGFADVERIAPWALDSVGRLVNCGVIRGDNNNNFRPKDKATRAEVAAILLRAKIFLEN